MLTALTDRARWLEQPWSSFGATCASDPAEVLARIAAHHGDFVLRELRHAESQPSPLLFALVDRASREAWRFALAAVVVDRALDPYGSPLQVRP